MVRLIGLMISIGLADSLNPSTIAPAIYLASEKHPRRRVLEFTVGVFGVYLLGGALIALGPGQLLRSIVPHPHRTLRQIGEIVAGALLIAAAAWLWRSRRRLADRGLPKVDPERRSSAVLGATITAIELPTAFPYFAAIAAVVSSGYNVVQQLGLLILFNVCFVLPMLLILATLTLAPDRSGQVLGRVRNFLERRWPHVLAILIFIVGVAALLLGITGFVANSRTSSGRFFQRFRDVLHLHP